jgi:hypothetical protein
MAGFKVPMDDLDPPKQRTKVLWGVIFCALGLAVIAWAGTLAANGQPVLILLVIATILISLGATSLLSRYVHTPA